MTYTKLLTQPLDDPTLPKEWENFEKFKKCLSCQNI